MKGQLNARLPGLRATCRLGAGGGAALTFAFTFNGEPFTFASVAFTFGAAS